MVKLELWGGAECTVNRVGDRWFDQAEKLGRRPGAGDFARFAELGLKALRYPMLWERFAAAPEAEEALAAADLDAIRDLGMRPIVGLIHHGSGPPSTDLLDEEGFVQGLAAHAGRVARRHPWLSQFTPVNEPLTTARFSCLYGHWHPHRHDEGAAWRALLNQVDAVRACMREIRRINPHAELVQTEDLGFTHATPTLAYQADFENERRWLTWDLLCGRVGRDHPLHGHLAAFGLGDRLAAIADDPCPPQTIGVNHYVTSERLLDHEARAYPAHLHGGNGRHAYADVEAVRAVVGGVIGVETLLRQTWERYGLPVAITECHNGCTRDEQMRWIWEAWNACLRLREAGCEITALTAWSLLGSVDWASLLTRDEGRYECGVFDVRGGEVRATATAALLADLGHGREPCNVALASAGWWRREVRYAFGRRVVAPAAPPPAPNPPVRAAAPILIIDAATGAGGALARACDHRALSFVTAAARSVEEETAIGKTLAHVRPCAVLVEAPATPALVRACADAGISLVVMPRAPGGLNVEDTDFANAALDVLIDGGTHVWNPLDGLVHPTPSNRAIDVAA